MNIILIVKTLLRLRMACYWFIFWEKIIFIWTNFFI